MSLAMEIWDYNILKKFIPWDDEIIIFILCKTPFIPHMYGRSGWNWSKKPLKFSSWRIDYTDMVLPEVAN